MLKCVVMTLLNCPPPPQPTATQNIWKRGSNPCIVIMHRKNRQYIIIIHHYHTTYMYVSQDKTYMKIERRQQESCCQDSKHNSLWYTNTTDKQYSYRSPGPTTLPLSFVLDPRGLDVRQYTCTRFLHLLTAITFALFLGCLSVIINQQLLKRVGLNRS